MVIGTFNLFGNIKLVNTLQWFNSFVWRRHCWTGIVWRRHWKVSVISAQCGFDGLNQQVFSIPFFITIQNNVVKNVLKAKIWSAEIIKYFNMHFPQILFYVVITWSTSRYDSYVNTGFCLQFSCFFFGMKTKNKWEI